MKDRKIPVLILSLLLCAGLLSGCGGKEEAVDVKTWRYDAGEFVTNIKDSGKMLRSAITIDLISESLLTTLEEKDYVAKDIILRRLRQLTEADVSSPDIEASLSKSLVQELNTAMNTEGFFKVYIVDFVYQ